MGMWLPEQMKVKTMTHMQAATHQGKLFSANHLFTGISDTNSVEMVGITGSKAAHLIVLIKSNGEAEIEFEKGTTFTDNGTEVTAVNRNETAKRTAKATIYHTPNVNSSGAVFSYGLIPGGSGKFTKVGGEVGQSEFIIAPNTNHLASVTNTSGSDSKILIEFIWAEH